MFNFFFFLCMFLKILSLLCIELQGSVATLTWKYLSKLLGLLFSPFETLLCLGCKQIEPSWTSRCSSLNSLKINEFKFELELSKLNKFKLKLEYNSNMRLNKFIWTYMNNMLFKLNFSLNWKYLSLSLRVWDWIWT